MDLNRKLELVQASIRSISEHRDEDTAVRSAALDHVDQMVKDERERMKAEVDPRKRLSFKPAAATEPLPPVPDPQPMRRQFPQSQRIALSDVGDAGEVFSS